MPMMKETELRRALGLLFAVRLPGSWAEIDLDRFPVANYIVFRDNMGDSFEATRRRLIEARSFLQARGIEPLFMTDEEGGRVTQISGFFQSAPSARAVSKALSPGEAGALYAQMSAYLADLGIDINLFPCVDVNSEPMNPIIGTRSYGTIPEDVAMYSHAAIEHSRTHVACVAKHFPGHGMTRLDSHLRQPVVEIPRDRLEYVHAHPFRKAISSGTDGIMVSHCLYLSLQTDNLPASLSKEIIGKRLREKLGYDGLVLTDSLDMQAVTKNVDAHQVGLLALGAGCDILVYTEYSERFEASFEALLGAFLMGKLSDQYLIDSSERRSRLIDRLRFVRGTRPAFEECKYIDLLDKVRAASIRISDPQGILPVSCNEAVVVSTSPATKERLKAYIPSIKDSWESSTTVAGTVILWLMEPLHPRQSFEKVRNLTERAGTSILITTYDSLRDMLPSCDAAVISDDTSPHAESAIMRRVFEG